MAALPHVGDQFLDYRLLAELGAGCLWPGVSGRAGRAAGGAQGRSRPSGRSRSRRLRHANIVPVEEVFHVGSFRGGRHAVPGRRDAGPRLEGASPDCRNRRSAGVALFAADPAGTAASGELPAADAALRPALEAVYYADAVLVAGRPDGRRAGPRPRPGRAAPGPEAGERAVHRAPAGRCSSTFTRRGTTSAEPAGGTLPYMAPEQIDAFRGRPPAVDARADLFALGVMLYQFFTGRLPYAAAPDDSANGLASGAGRTRATAAGPGGRQPGRAAGGRCRRHAIARTQARMTDLQMRQELVKELRRVLRDMPLPLRAGPGWFAATAGAVQILSEPGRSDGRSHSLHRRACGLTSRFYARRRRAYAEPAQSRLTPGASGSLAPASSP